MKKALISLFALASMAMGGKKPDIPQPPPNGATAPEVYETRFRSYGQTYGADYVGKTIAYSFGSFFGSTIGMCSYNSSGRNSIKYSSSAWGRNSDTFREMLSFHELGHCLLGRGHKNAKHSDGSPESLMNSFIFNEKTYLANKDRYLKELFTAESALQEVTQSLAAHQFEGCGWFRHRSSGTD